MKKVLAAMSGGVDSSLIASLLLEHGFESVSVTMLLGNDKNFLTKTDASPEHFSMEPAEQFPAVKDMRSQGFQQIPLTVVLVQVCIVCEFFVSCQR